MAGLEVTPGRIRTDNLRLRHRGALSKFELRGNAVSVAQAVRKAGLLRFAAHKRRLALQTKEQYMFETKKSKGY